MPKFRKKPIVINAEQFFPDKKPWPEGVMVGPSSQGTWCVSTLEGVHVVTPGDWIITGIEGERYACKPDIFERTYEPIADTMSKSTEEGGGD